MVYHLSLQDYLLNYLIIARGLPSLKEVGEAEEVEEVEEVFFNSLKDYLLNLLFPDIYSNIVCTIYAEPPI
jgi:hypothetical protein